MLVGTLTKVGHSRLGTIRSRSVVTEYSKCPTGCFIPAGTNALSRFLSHPRGTKTRPQVRVYPEARVSPEQRRTGCVEARAAQGRRGGSHRMWKPPPASPGNPPLAHRGGMSPPAENQLRGRWQEVPAGHEAPHGAGGVCSRARGKTAYRCTGTRAATRFHEHATSTTARKSAFRCTID